MSFLGQFSFGYPVISRNIISTPPDGSVFPLSVGSSLQGNILGITFSDLRDAIQSGTAYDYNFAVTGENESIVTTVDKITVYATRDFKVSEIGYSIVNVGSGVSSMSVTVKKNGGTANAYVLPSITPIQYNTLSSPLIFAKGDAIAINMSVTATVPPKGLKIYLIGETI